MCSEAAGKGKACSQQVPKSSGHEIGEWHVTHDKLVFYFLKLAEVSPRVSVEQMGKTYEGRSLLNVIITSEENHKKLEELRLEHLKLCDPAQSDNLNISNLHSGWIHYLSEVMTRFVQ